MLLDLLAPTARERFIHVLILLNASSIDSSSIISLIMNVNEHTIIMSSLLHYGASGYVTGCPVMQPANGWASVRNINTIKATSMIKFCTVIVNYAKKQPLRTSFNKVSVPPMSTWRRGYPAKNITSILTKPSKYHS